MGKYMKALFQSTPPCGGDTAVCPDDSPKGYFNPRPLAGATYLPAADPHDGHISIHAPLRGRPEESQRAAGAVKFQSTPPCGGDGQRSRIPALSPNFNPRPLAGATLDDGFDVMEDGFQSTPPCGGDGPVGEALTRVQDFNPRPLAGATRTPSGYGLFAIFQSTPPCGGDLNSLADGNLLDNFNPRPLAGATAPCQFVRPHYRISIHAPLRGRHEMEQIYVNSIKFQSTPPCGGDELTILLFGKEKNFNPRPLAGATWRSLQKATGGPISIHAPLRGRLASSFSSPFLLLFQSTPPCGGDG